MNPKGMATPAQSRVSRRDTLERPRDLCDRNHRDMGTTMVFLGFV